VYQMMGIITATFSRVGKYD